MKIKELQISNILSFKHFADVSESPKIIFDSGLNILIGENGSGKSTALEAINFIFKKVLFTQFNVNQDLYDKRGTVLSAQKRKIVTNANNQSYSGFRLDRNWNTESEPGKIRLVIELDDVDSTNVSNLVRNEEKLKGIANLYSPTWVVPEALSNKTYTIEVTLHNEDNKFSVVLSPNDDRRGYEYLVHYNFYKELINLYNLENPSDLIEPLYESLVLIGGYRNYDSFNPVVSLGGTYASQQIREIRSREFSKSLNVNEKSEPEVFNLVRLKIAEIHYDLAKTSLDLDEAIDRANESTLLIKINEKLELVGLECKIRLENRMKRNYAFEFIDIKRGEVVGDINGLSSGQKALIHLIFEAYGRGGIKGGVVIIDEPEIHLHYQFQNEYLRVIEDINQEQESQYVLVTHSESLIDSVTIHKVKRFTRDADMNTDIKSPVLNESQKTLIKILENTRSTYAFFAKKVILVEGETDRYFFKELIKKVDPSGSRDIAVLDIGGKPNFEIWKEFFEQFGLLVYTITDLDGAFNLLYPTDTVYKLNSPGEIARFQADHTDLEADIEAKYGDKIYILKSGDLEVYLGLTSKKLPKIIEFCNNDLDDYLADTRSDLAEEMTVIAKEIINN